MTTQVSDAFSGAFRDFNLDGVPTSGARAVPKVEVRAAAAVIDSVAAQLAAATAAVDARIDAVEAVQGAGGLAFETKTAMDAALDYAANTKAEVYNDSTPGNNGVYRKIGASGTGSWEFVTPLGLASLSLDVGALSQALVGALADLYPHLGVFDGSDGVYPILTDKNGVVILGFDVNEGSLVGAAASPLTAGTQLIALPEDRVFTAIPASRHAALADWNGFISYGQSNSIGSGGTPVITEAQPYYNLTFDAGPKSTKADSTGSNPGTDDVKPLVEDSLSTYGSGGGETICSGAANTCVEYAAIQNGIDPADLVMFASAAGRGSYTIAQLGVGSAWYQVILDQINEFAARAVDNSKSSAVHAVPWLHGEADYETSPSSYAAALIALQAKIESDVKAATGQTHPVPMLLWQMGAYASLEGGAIQRLFLSMGSGAYDQFMFVTPNYHLPYREDGLHLSALGHKLLGCYFGRALKRIIIDKARPEFIQPLSATARGDKVTIRFRVPQRPLVLDAVNLAATADHGFVIEDATGVLTLSAPAVTADGAGVEWTVNRAFDSDPVVRYALDAVGSGLTLVETDGASGNLRDSTADTTTINGVTYPLWHACPHFSLPIRVLELDT